MPKQTNEKLLDLCTKALEMARKSGGIVKPNVSVIATKAGVKQPEASKVLIALRYVS